jgi:hypothetical protein
MKYHSCVMVAFAVIILRHSRKAVFLYWKFVGTKADAAQPQ